MITFNELRIGADGILVVDASVLYTSIDPEGTIGINHIYIGYGTNRQPLSDYMDYIDNPAIFDRVDKLNGVVRGFRLTLNLKPDGNNKKLVYASVSVDPGTIDVPCTLSTSIEGYAYDKCVLFDNVIDYIKKSGAECSNIQDYANKIVQVEGLEIAVESGNFNLANLYWNKFFANGSYESGITHQNGCRCRH